MLSPKKLLNKEQYKEYVRTRQEPQRIKLLQRIAEAQRQQPIIRSQDNYSRTKSGKFGEFIAKGIRMAQPGGVTRALYSKQIAPTNPYGGSMRRVKTIRGVATGRRGRPRGSLDQRYAQYGGVYGYRKYMAQQMRLQRIEAMKRATINPQQAEVIRRIEQRQQYEQQNPENKIIPDTYGNVPMRRIQQDIDDAVNLVD